MMLNCSKSLDKAPNQVTLYDLLKLGGGGGGMCVCGGNYYNRDHLTNRKYLRVN